MNIFRRTTSSLFILSFFTSSLMAQVAGITSGQGGVIHNNMEHKNPQDLKSKEVSQEISISKTAEIYIENNSRSIEIKTWDQSKVKVVTTAYFDKESSITDAEWFERLGISFKTLGNSVKVKSSASVFGWQSYNHDPIVVTDYPAQITTSGTVQLAQGANSSNKNALKKIMTIYVPAGSKLDIESKYADVKLPSGIGDVILDISNGNLEADNLNKLRLRSKYSNTHVRDIKEAEIELANGRFTANNIDDMDIEAKYSTIEMASAKKIKMISSNDEFEIEDAGEISGRKNYGNLRITRLNGSINLDGGNADIKVRNLGSGVKQIKINNKYANIRIPLRDSKNYSVTLIGAYNNIYSDFEKEPVQVSEEEQKAYTSFLQTYNQNAVSGGSITKSGSGQQGNVMNLSSSARPTMASGTINATTVFSATAPTAKNIIGHQFTGHTPVKFTGTSGDGKGLKMDIQCYNCTVDFK